MKFASSEGLLLPSPSCKDIFNLFSVPFDVNVENFWTELRMLISVLQRDMGMRNTFTHVRLFDFYKPFSLADNFPVLSDHAQRMTYVFRSTCFWTFLLKMEVVKTKSINRLDDERLESCLWVSTSHIVQIMRIWRQRNSGKHLTDVLACLKVKLLSP